MPTIERSALVSYRCEQMFALVNDVARYPEFMPGCRAVEILHQTETELTARLTLGLGVLQQQFATRNRLTPPHRMEMALVEGPFDQFEGEWRFEPLGDLGCKVSFRLNFTLSGRLLSAAAGKLLESAASEQVAAICARAQQVYTEVP